MTIEVALRRTIEIDERAMELPCLIQTKSRLVHSLAMEACDNVDQNLNLHACTTIHQDTLTSWMLRMYVQIFIAYILTTNA